MITKKILCLLVSLLKNDDLRFLLCGWEVCIYINFFIFSEQDKVFTNVNLGFWIPSLAIMAENLIESFSIIIIIFYLNLV